MCKDCEAEAQRVREKVTRDRDGEISRFGVFGASVLVFILKAMAAIEVFKGEL